MRSFLYFVMAIGLMGFVAGSPAAAQTTNPVRSGTWYEDRTIGGSSDTFVSVKFALTPADKLVNVTNVGCVVNSSGPVYSAKLWIGTTSGGQETGRYAAISIGEPLLYAGRYYYTFNSSLFLKIGKNRYPTLFMGQFVSTLTYSMNADCTIVGTLSND